MKHKIGTLCMVLGTVLVAAALSLFLYNQTEDREAGKASQKVLERVKEELEQEETESEALPDPYDTEMTVRIIDGYGYIGYLSIPDLGLELPVMSEWDYPRLRIAPCRYTGSTKSHDLVVAAHNYTRHFGLLSNLNIGAQVLFTDMDDVTTVYDVAEIEVLKPTEVVPMINSDYDLTLFTCTPGGATRVTVRCLQTKQGTKKTTDDA